MYSQNYKSGFIVEIAGLSTNTSSFEKLDDEKEFVTGYGISYSGKFRLSPTYQLEFRPGLFFTQKYYHGFQFGFFLRRSIAENFFGIIGVNSSLNFTGNSRSFTHPTLSYAVGATAGLNLSEDFSALLSFYKTLDNIYGHGSTSTTYFTKYLYWLMKLGVEYNL
jgi:hypothetical protein